MKSITLESKSSTARALIMNSSIIISTAILLAPERKLSTDPFRQLRWSNNICGITSLQSQGRAVTVDDERCFTHLWYRGCWRRVVFQDWCREWLGKLYVRLSSLGSYIVDRIWNVFWREKGCDWWQKVQFLVNARYKSDASSQLDAWIGSDFWECLPSLGIDLLWLKRSWRLCPCKNFQEWYPCHNVMTLIKTARTPKTIVAIVSVEIDEEGEELKLNSRLELKLVKGDIFKRTRTFAMKRAGDEENNYHD